MWTLLVVAYASLAVVAGLVLLRRAFARPVLLVEELAVAMSWAFPVGGAIWFRAWVTDSAFLGFSSPWTWLTAAHFHVAGFGALLISALSTRAIRSPRSRHAMHALLVLHPLAFTCVAAGLAGVPEADRIGALGYLAIFVTQAVVVGVAVPRAPADAMRARGAVRTAGVALLLTALLVPIVTLVPAAAWALDMPLWNLDDMIRYHGIANTIGHAALGLVALAILRPAPAVGVLKAPLSRLRARGRVGPGFLGDYAPTAPKDPTGLSDDLARYTREGFDVAALHPEVRAFYENTKDFELDVDGQWRTPFRGGGWLWANVISPRLGQLGLPSPRQTLEGAALDSRIVDVDDTRDGRDNVRGWVRTWRSTGAPIYIAAYAEHRRDGIRTMNIAFPLPGACLTSILHLTHAGRDGLQLTSRHHEHFDGDQGIYLARGSSPFRLPMDETITVWPASASEREAGSCLEARHDMWLFGLRFLTLHYRIRRIAGVMSGP
jgi:hypothetical protein